jgi:hypothetical protein
MDRPEKWIVEPITGREKCRAYLLHLCIPITNSMLLLFEEIDGVESAKISTRYRFKFDIAQCFGKADVLERVEDWAMSHFDKFTDSETGGSDNAPVRLKELLCQKE